MAANSPAEAESLRGLNDARRAIGFQRAKVVTDEKVYRSLSDEIAHWG